MPDFPVMLWEKLPVVDRIQPQRNNFAMDVENIRLQVILITALVMYL